MLLKTTFLMLTLLSGIAATENVKKWFSFQTTPYWQQHYNATTYPWRRSTHYPTARFRTPEKTTVYYRRYSTHGRRYGTGQVSTGRYSTHYRRYGTGKATTGRYSTHGRRYGTGKVSTGRYSTHYRRYGTGRVTTGRYSTHGRRYGTHHHRGKKHFITLGRGDQLFVHGVKKRST